MNLTHLQHDMPAYQDWLNRNPNGFVLNFPERKPPKLHTAQCSHIRPESSPTVNVQQNLKACSPDQEDIDTYFNYVTCGDCIKNEEAN